MVLSPNGTQQGVVNGAEISDAILDYILTATTCTAGVGQYAEQQFSCYDFHVSSNAIVDLMGIEARRSKEERAHYGNVSLYGSSLFAENVIQSGHSMAPKQQFSGKTRFVLCAL